MHIPYAPGPKGGIRSVFCEGGTHRIGACQECLMEDGRAHTLPNVDARVSAHLRMVAYHSVAVTDAAPSPAAPSASGGSTCTLPPSTRTRPSASSWMTSG